MKLVQVDPDDILLTNDLTRSGRSKQFEERLESSIDAMGLAEPLKVARLPDTDAPGKKYLLVDGVMRFRAIAALRAKDASRFRRIPAYVVEYSKRYEIRYQTDIYQDLLPSQLASLVEHLHQAERVSKSDIAQYIGVSAATLRNYTGLWRLMQRGGLFAKIVSLMDVGIVPASNPYAWLRLTAAGIRFAIETELAQGGTAEAWVEARLMEARQGQVRALPLKFVEAVTGGLAPHCYREDAAVREMKQRLGLRRAARLQRPASNARAALPHLDRVAARTHDPVLRMAATSLRSYLK